MRTDASAKNNMATKRKKLKLSTVQSISGSVDKPTEDSTTEVLEALKKLRHMSTFPQRQQICEILQADIELLGNLVSSLVKDSAHLYKQEKGSTKYADFQVHWLEHVHQVAVRGAALTTSDAQDVDSDTVVLTSSSAAEQWSHIYIHAQSELGEIDPDTNMMVLHSVARSVFNQQHERIREHVSNTIAEDRPSSSQPPSQPSPDDALLRMCGAEIAHMIKLRRKEKSTQLKSGRQQIDDLDEELSILKCLCIPSDQKQSMAEEIPLGIRNLDMTGYLWIPHPDLLPFLRKVDEVFRSQVNESTFRKYGETLFKVSETHFLRHRDQLYDLFLSSMPVKKDSELLRSIYNELWSKMVNLRKEDWRASRQRIAVQKSGKTSSTTLMLRDELKPIAAKKVNK